MATQQSGSGGHQHSYPVGRGHVTRGTDCWCGPQHFQLCPECEGDPAGCWKCQDQPGGRPGLLRITPEYARVIGEGLVIVHANCGSAP